MSTEKPCPCVKNDPMWEVAYVTKSGKHARKVVRESKLPATVEKLEEAGAYNFNYRPNE